MSRDRRSQASAMRPNRASGAPRLISRGRWQALFGCVLGLISFAVLARSPLEPVTEDMPPLKTLDFTVAPPTGEHWLYYQRAFPGYVTFRKQDPIKKVLPGGEHLSFIIEIKAEKFPGHDLSTGAGLEAALKSALYDSPDVYKYGMLRVQGFTWQDTDCASYLMAREEPQMLDGKPVVFVWQTEGIFCRHPANPDVAVTGLFQERRLDTLPSRLDDVLRAEAEQTLQSIRFLPAAK